MSVRMSGSEVPESATCACCNDERGAGLRTPECVPAAARRHRARATRSSAKDRNSFECPRAVLRPAHNRCVPHLGGARLPHVTPAAASSLISSSRSEPHENHDWFVVNHEDKRLDDCCHVAANGTSSILGCSRPVRECTNLDLQAAARRSGDQSFRAGHTSPLRDLAATQHPELQRVLASTTNQCRIRIVDLSGDGRRICARGWPG